jgi:hypothetical protein
VSIHQASIPISRLPCSTSSSTHDSSSWTHAVCPTVSCERARASDASPKGVRPKACHHKVHRRARRRGGVHVISGIAIDYRMLRADDLLRPTREKPLASERKQLLLTLGRLVEREEGSHHRHGVVRRVASEQVGSLHRESDAQPLYVKRIVCRAHRSRAVVSRETTRSPCTQHASNAVMHAARLECSHARSLE